MRRTLLAAYLILLAASTLVRWRSGSPAPQGAADSLSTMLAPVEATHRLIVLGPRMDAARAIEGADARPVDLLAFGTAGPTAITLAARHPDRIRSLTLVDADGIEEFDLLGDHHLNQVLRRAEIISLDLLRWGLPHFGALDRGPFLAERARALLPLDRRGIRRALTEWNGPTLILDAHADAAHIATAREHARLLPQAVLAPFALDTLRAFLAAVDAGAATTRGTAPADRRAAATLPFDAGGLASAQGVSLFVVLALLALTTLLSEDLACVAAGVLAARGSIPLWPAIAACYLGIIIGDQLLYLLGRSLGHAVLTRAPIRWWLSSADLERAYQWVDRQGMRVVLTSRFLPGTRFPVYVVAGALRAGFVRFAVWLMIIGAVWTPALVGVSYAAGRSGRDLVESLPGATWPWAVLGVILMTLGVRVAVRAVGRRQGADR